MIWLASYPRSGNTWMRFLLYAYLEGRVRDFKSVEARIPNLHRGGLDRLPPAAPVLCKTHLLLDSRHPQLAATTGAIYLVRHPKDVLLSNLNYSRLWSEDLDARQFALDFIREGGVPEWRAAGLGSWAGHVRSWTETAAFPCLTIHYESMLRDPRDSLAAALRFAGVEPERRRLDRAVRACSLQRLRRIELADRASADPSLIPGGRQALTPRVFFFHRGAAAQSLAALGADLDALCEARFAGELELLNAAQPRRREPLGERFLGGDS